MNRYQFEFYTQPLGTLFHQFIDADSRSDAWHELVTLFPHLYSACLVDFELEGDV